MKIKIDWPKAGCSDCLYNVRCSPKEMMMSTIERQCVLELEVDWNVVSSTGTFTLKKEYQDND